jgi:divalent metal cation (Fe/Co/Zn/Cd) transporter
VCASDSLWHLEATAISGVFGLDKCIVRRMGLTYYLDLHVVVQRELSVREGHRLSHTVEDEILRALPQVAEFLVHVEPEEDDTRISKTWRDYEKDITRAGE